MSSHIPSDRLSVRRFCILSIMAALMFASKVALASLPNINLNALLIILTTVSFGWHALYAVAVYIMLEGIVFGFSVWWISYLLVWPLLTVIVMAMRKNGSPVIWAVLAGVYGLLFGAVTGAAAPAVSLALIHGKKLLLVSLAVLLAASLLREKYGSARVWLAKRPLPLRWAAYLALLFAVLFEGQYGPGFEAADFIYQGF